MKTSVLFAFLFCSLLATAQVTTLEPGDTAPTFSLKNIDGKKVSPDDFPNAKGFILVFTANTCPYAIAYEKRLVELNEKFSRLGYPVIAINPNPQKLSAGDSFEKMQEKAKEANFSFPYLLDEGQTITNHYGARVTPHIFLLQKKEDNLKIVYTGAIDNDTEDKNPDKIKYVENAIAALESGKNIEVASTKAIGCTVKRPAAD
ncbi:thioredoxin family protein [Antarcticibacterium flavum]|uniref:Thioredoxin family protein n=1 Tax=Antarcticibacterium flavum TaxID=2058175 RepID=A0A5B7X167_9FLAO|nr:MULTISPECIES: thioredoxin family protein [Antarcticibacterium]MCM4161251.1 thioredoxin family protein [Antarcticibacterium sp. W02-3]QCY68432.1 thioredoxin family protein [Antarcticibacterium flavum]